MLRVLFVSLLDILYQFILEIMYGSSIPYSLQMYHLNYEASIFSDEVMIECTSVCLWRCSSLVQSHLFKLLTYNVVCH